MIQEIEDKIDRWLYDNLQGDIPRNKYIYHCNLAYIDIMVDEKMLFTQFERHLLFSLNYNIHIAYMKLEEEDSFDYSFDYSLYPIAFNMILKGIQYSRLCDIFPMLHSEKGEMLVKGKDIILKVNELPKRHYKFLSEFSMRKSLSYTLQMATGRMEHSSLNDEEVAMNLSKIYMHFWSENMQYDDYEPYTRMDWGGISFFFVLAAMRRFNKLYKQNFDIIAVDSQKMMIILSPNGVEKVREYVPSDNEALYQQAFEDHIYKPRGKGTYPKSNIADAPLIRTKDGYIIANPMVILFNDSLETQFLNYLRRCDNKRYLKIKDKIKEREIPLIKEMINYKWSSVKAITNFNVKMPNLNNKKRECDLLLVDDSGNALYLEFKHFYYPMSYCEEKVLDKELSLALEKMPKQLEAIRFDWEKLRTQYEMNCELEKLHGVIVSHRYTGVDVEIVPEIPIVGFTDLMMSIGEANTLEEIYLGCREVDELYPQIEFIQRDLSINYAGYTFHVSDECLNPIHEILLTDTYKKRSRKRLSSPLAREFTNIKDLARAYIDEMNETS